MSEEIFYPSKSISAKALIQNMDQYQEMYDRSINEPEKFWAEEADKFTWFKKWDQVRSYNYNVNNGKINIEWFKGAETNITINCL
ncbi:MAG: acetyl-coenzyme A synthetase N-terminal domain-containing protein, partial [Nitrospinaceae bacterium]